MQSGSLTGDGANAADCSRSDNNNSISPCGDDAGSRSGQAVRVVLLSEARVVTASKGHQSPKGQQMRDTFFLGRRGYSRAKTETFGVHLGMGIGLVRTLS